MKPGDIIKHFTATDSAFLVFSAEWNEDKNYMKVTGKYLILGVDRSYLPPFGVDTFNISLDKLDQWQISCAPTAGCLRYEPWESIRVA